MRAYIASLLLLTAASANAGIVKLDAQTLAPGTDISQSLEGVRILSYLSDGSSSQAYSPLVAPVVVDVCPDQSYCSQQVFARGGESPMSNWGLLTDAYRCESTGGFACRDSFSHVMNIFIDEGTDYFSFESYWLSDKPGLFAFNASGELLFSCFTFVAGDCFQTSSTLASPGLPSSTLMGFSRAQADVSRVAIGIVDGMGRIQGLSVSVSVPEPSTVVLFAGALVLVMLFRRRRPAEVRT